MQERGVLTMAFGADVYREQAVALGLSLRRNAPDLPRAIVTDDPTRFRGLYEHVVDLRPELGRNVQQKLHLDGYTPFEETLFIDGDCLVVRSLDSVWRRLAGRPFAVVGADPRMGGTWIGADIEALRGRLGLPGPVHAFNSGVIHWTRGTGSDRVFSRARALLPEYDRLGFGNAAGKRWHVSDEPLFAIAMAEQELVPLDDHEDVVMRTMINMRGPLEIDVLAQRCSFSKMHAGRPFRVEPAIAHFAGQYTRSWYYRRERARLRWAEEAGVRGMLASSPVRRTTDVALGASAVAQQVLHRSVKALVRHGRSAAAA